MKEKILEVGKELALEIGPQNIGLDDICTLTGVKAGSFQYVMGMSFNKFLETLPLGENCQVKNRSTLPIFRKRHIIKCCISHSADYSFKTITINLAAALAKVSRSTVCRYYKTHEEIQDQIMELAVQTECIEVIAQGLASRHPLALDASQILKERAAKHIANL